MKTHLVSLLAALALVVGLTAPRPGWAGQDFDQAKEEAALLKKAEAFVEDFHRGDAKALAAHWAADGDYTDQRGRYLKGREAIEKVFKEMFAENKGLKLRINMKSVHFMTPDVAVEDGTTEVIPPDGAPPSRARYTVVYVKKEGQWLLGSVRDAIFVPPTNYEFLRGLEWAIGEWVSEGNTGESARLTFAWSEHQNFIINTFTTSHRNLTVGSGTQYIGWDPLEKKLRSWAFETTGSFGEGSISQDGDRWIVKFSFVLRDAKKLTATNVVTRLDADTITWQSKDRAMDGKALPDVKEVKLKRVK
jgi:uncharacterized protein (TIGR02246 family)